MPSEVRDKLANDLECFGESYGEVKLQDTDKYVKQGVDKILSVIGEEIEGMKKQPEKIPYSECSQGSGFVNSKPEETIITVEKTYLEIKYDEYNRALTDLRARLEGK